MIIYVACAALVCGYLAFALNFTRATLYVGQEIATPEAARNIQDAITPPSSSVFFLTALFLFIGCVVAAFIMHGWVIGIVSAPALFLVVMLFRWIVPAPESRFFRGVILRSMQNRYADFIKSGDTVRARAMADLLTRMGHPIPPHLRPD